MKKKRNLLFLILAMTGILRVSAQQNNRTLNPKMDLIAKPGSTPEWIDFRDDVELNPASLFIDYSTYFNLTSNEEMRVKKILDDELGYKHYRYQQYAFGYRVEAGEFIVHVNASNHTYAANGKMVVGLQAPRAAALSASAAQQKAMQAMGATAWCWDSEYWQKEIKDRTGDLTASYAPKPELVWFNDREMKNWNPQAFRLAWTMDLYAASPHRSERYYIDAMTGEVLAVVALESNCSSATVNTVFNGNRTMYTYYLPVLNRYYMQDDCQTAGWIVKDWGSTTSTANPFDIFNTTNTWTTNDQRFAGTVNWEIKKAYLYYLNVHSRASYDNANGAVTAYINAVFNNGSVDYTDNASMSFTGGTMKVGLGSSGTLANSWCPLDVIGHEYTHAVTGATAALTYSYESGALNESFSDIFGEVIESYTLGTNDWLMGNDRTSGAIRSMANPGLYNDPDTYLGTNWYSGTGDAGGVHTNSGVQNYWFYLLAAGGSGTNDNGQSFSVSGIGLGAARAIAYRNLTYYLGSGSQYVDAREGAIRSAVDIYGSCSNQAIQTGAAWFAVGVGNSLPQFNYTITCGSTVVGGTSSGINTLVTATGTGCSTGATPSFSNVVFRATDYIDLRTGFTGSAYNTNYFSAVIDPCSYTTYRVTAPEYDAEAAEDGSAAIANDKSIVDESLQLNVWPNPCREQSELSFVITQEQQVVIRLYDQKGALVNDIDAGRVLPAGIHRYHMETSALLPGNYQIVIDLGDKKLTRQLIKNE
ncbi:MAG: M4 family metallopeptidase [Bacteroidia bacterium]